MDSFSENTKASDDSNVISVMFLQTDTISKEDILEGLAPTNSKVFPKMIDAIFDMPIKEPGTSQALQALLRLSEEADVEEDRDDLYEDQYDRVDSLWHLIFDMLDHCQGISLHIIAKLELLSAMLGHILEESYMTQFRTTAYKWLNAIQDNTKE